ncbi:MAG TPA: hypothetical protein VHA82_02610, partial [Ramlibacter sp.]|uniref:type IV pilus assembly protein FimV n=1 Tax=Ramlibacter sp. TaxID=1917967 RepID=UPI002C22120E|nr:hypothetical protein [Ramlibacter sp.]
MIFRLKPVAAALLACLALHAPVARAVALGQFRVLSNQGEPLLAEVEIPELSAPDAGALRAGLGTPEDYQATGMSLDPSLQGMRIWLNRRADGRYFLRLAGTRPVTAGSVDIILQVQGVSRSVWRDYRVPVSPRARAEAEVAQPLALGLARVLSQRGEPLRAEIDVPVVPKGQEAGVRAGLASASDFAAAGMDRPELGNVRMQLQKKADGRSVLSVTSDKPVDSASVNLLLDAQWPSGRIVRDYSLAMPPPPQTAAATSRAAAGSIGTEQQVAAAPPPPPSPLPTAQQRATITSPPAATPGGGAGAGAPSPLVLNEASGPAARSSSPAPLPPSPAAAPAGAGSPAVQLFTPVAPPASVSPPPPPVAVASPPSPPVPVRAAPALPVPGPVAVAPP